MRCGFCRERLGRVLLRWKAGRGSGFGVLHAGRSVRWWRLSCHEVVLVVDGQGVCNVYGCTLDGPYAGLKRAVVQVSFLCEFILPRFCC